MSLYTQSHNCLYNQLRHSKHMLTDALRMFVDGEEFRVAMAAAEGSAEIKAYLTIRALEGISLDPMTGAESGSFVTLGQREIHVHVRFHRWVNFIGIFSLSADSPLAQPLVDALERNLKGRMFKAATIERRVHRRAVRLMTAAAMAAHAAYRSVTAGKQGGDLTDTVRAIADAAYDRIYDRRQAQIDARMQALTRSATPGFLADYVSGVTEFLFKHLPIEEMACAR